MYSWAPTMSSISRTTAAGVWACGPGESAGIWQRRQFRVDLWGDALTLMKISYVVLVLVIPQALYGYA
jgi:hypothetical protein